MGLFDSVKDAFKKDEQKPTQPSSPQSPGPHADHSSEPVVDWIIQKRTGGTDDDEIKRILLAHKHTPQDIEDAFRKADALYGPEPLSPPEFPDQKQIIIPPKLNDDVQPYQQSQSLAEIENLVDERVKRVQGDLDALQKWKQQVDSDIEQLKTSVSQLTDLLKDSRDKEREKFEEYDRHLSEVKVELKATQEVFRKGLPEFTKGIQELSRMVKRGKGE